MRDPHVKTRPVRLYSLWCSPDTNSCLLLTWARVLPARLGSLSSGRSASLAAAPGSAAGVGCAAAAAPIGCAATAPAAPSPASRFFLCRHRRIRSAGGTGACFAGLPALLEADGINNLASAISEMASRRTRASTSATTPTYNQPSRCFHAGLGTDPRGMPSASPRENHRGIIWCPKGPERSRCYENYSPVTRLARPGLSHQARPLARSSAGTLRPRQN